MDNFERLTRRPGARWGLLPLPAPCSSGLWDDEFHRRRCAFCTRENCDECPNEEGTGKPGVVARARGKGGGQ